MADDTSQTNPGRTEDTRRDRTDGDGVRILGADEARPRVRRPAAVDATQSPPLRFPIPGDAGRGPTPSASARQPPTAPPTRGPMWASDDDDGDGEFATGGEDLYEAEGGQDDDGVEENASWSSFTGSGPRWRDHPGDWDDADVHGALGEDDEIRVGALNPDREVKAASFTFDDEEFAEAASPAGRRASVRAPDDVGPPPDRTRPSQRTEAGRARPARAEAAVPAPAAGRDLPTAIATGVVLGAGALLLLVVGKGKGGLVLVLFALLAAGFEMFTALRQRAFQPAIPLGLAAIGGLTAATYRNGTDGMALILGIAILATMLWYLFGITRDRPAVNIAVTWFVVLYIGVLGAFSAGLLRLPDGRWVFLAPVVGTVAYDTFGYLFGRTMGNRKLAPEVSPNKTWEGTVGGFLGCLVVCGLLFGIKGVGPWNGKEGWLLGLVVGVAAPLGDLCESLVKRDLGIKDASNLLPGHGGVLDRIDAMLFAVPATYFLIRIIGIY